MKVSIIIATYGEQHWADLAETRARPSADRQYEQVNGYWKTPQVAVGHFPNESIASARNTMALSVPGDWLCFLDADDELAPGYLDAMRRAYEREQGDGPLLLTPAVSYVRKGRPSPPKFMDRGISLRDDNWLVVGTLVQKDFFMEVGGFSDYEHGFEDFACWSKCYRAGARVVKVPDAVYLAHVNPKSKHRQGWRNHKWQVATHQRVVRELDAWEAARV